jgi:hypothetical protein
MNTFTTVMFSREEREVFGRANVHLTLAFPGAGQANSRGGKADREDPNQRARIVYTLGIDHKIGDRAGLERARAVYKALLDKARTDIVFWTAERDRVVSSRSERSETSDETEGPGPIVADPVQACEVLIEARTMQIGHARDALDLVDRALRLIPDHERVPATVEA